MKDEHCYLMEGPEGLRETCDVLLNLDDGTQLPVHSPVIARCSPLFHSMLAEGILINTSAASNVALAFGECSQEEAIAFLSVVYSLAPHKHIVKESAMSVARLGDKYGVKVHA